MCRSFFEKVLPPKFKFLLPAAAPAAPAAPAAAAAAVAAAAADNGIIHYIYYKILILIKIEILLTLIFYFIMQYRQHAAFTAAYTVDAVEEREDGIIKYILRNIYPHKIKILLTLILLKFIMQYRQHAAAAAYCIPWLLLKSESKELFSIYTTKY